jgi:hypothetical protein
MPVIRKYAFDLVFASAAARLSFSPSVTDVYKVARQLDNGSYWHLTSVSPVTWKSVDETEYLATGGMDDAEQIIFQGFVDGQPATRVEFPFNHRPGSTGGVTTGIGVTEGVAGNCANINCWGHNEDPDGDVGHAELYASGMGARLRLTRRGLTSQPAVEALSSETRAFVELRDETAVGANGPSEVGLHSSAGVMETWVVLTSADGSKWKITINDSGVLNTEIL